MTLETNTLPRSATPGPEMAALAPFYRDWSWVGDIVPGGMGPGSPGMRGIGHARCRLIMDGLWYDCDFEQDQRLADGTHVLTWHLAWITGWDGHAGEYRAVSADDQGPTLGVFRGWIDGSTLVYETLGDGGPRIRLTWIPQGADHCLWRNEASLDGVSWTLVEEYRMEASSAQAMRHVRSRC
jgi:hypothetical protein